MRKEATGYGVVYFMKQMLEHECDSVEGKKCIVSGSGNVALYCIQKLMQMGGKVVTASDSSGFIYDAKGIDEEKFAFLIDLKEKRRGRIEEYAEKFGCEFHSDILARVMFCETESGKGRSGRDARAHGLEWDAPATF